MTETTDRRTAGTTTAGGATGTTGRQPLVLPVLIVSVVAAVALVVTGATAVVGSFFERRQTETRTFSETLDRVRVGLDTGDVRVLVGTAGEPVRLITRRNVAFGTADVTANVDGTTLDVRGRCRGAWWPVDRCTVDADLRVPPGTVLELTSDTGDINVLGAAGAVSARTDTGDVRVNGARGVLSLQTDTGDVHGIALGSESVQGQTDTGDVRVRFLTEPRRVTVRSDTGDVEVQVPDGATGYRVVTDTDTGEARVDVPSSPTSDRLITASTSTGDVRILPAP